MANGMNLFSGSAIFVSHQWVNPVMKVTQCSYIDSNLSAVDSIKTFPVSSNSTLKKNGMIKNTEIVLLLFVQLHGATWNNGSDLTA